MTFANEEVFVVGVPAGLRRLRLSLATSSQLCLLTNNPPAPAEREREEEEFQSLYIMAHPRPDECRFYSEESCVSMQEPIEQAREFLSDEAIVLT